MNRFPIEQYPELYYQDRQPEKQYAHTGGELDINRCLNNHPQCWVVTSKTHRPLKKKIYGDPAFWDMVGFYSTSCYETNSSRAFYKAGPSHEEYRLGQWLILSTSVGVGKAVWKRARLGRKSYRLPYSLGENFELINIESTRHPSLCYNFFLIYFYTLNGVSRDRYAKDQVLVWPPNNVVDYVPLPDKELEIWNELDFNVQNNQTQLFEKLDTFNDHIKEGTKRSLACHYRKQLTKRESAFLEKYITLTDDKILLLLSDDNVQDFHQFFATPSFIKALTESPALKIDIAFVEVAPKHFKGQAAECFNRLLQTIRKHQSCLSKKQFTFIFPSTPYNDKMPPKEITAEDIQDVKGAKDLLFDLTLDLGEQQHIIKNILRYSDGYPLSTEAIKKDYLSHLNSLLSHPKLKVPIRQKMNETIQMLLETPERPKGYVKEMRNRVKEEDDDGEVRRSSIKIIGTLLLNLPIFNKDLSGPEIMFSMDNGLNILNHLKYRLKSQSKSNNKLAFNQEIIDRFKSYVVFDRDGEGHSKHRLSEIGLLFDEDPEPTPSLSPGARLSELIKRETSSPERSTTITQFEQRTSALLHRSTDSATTLLFERLGNPLCFLEEFDHRLYRHNIWIPDFEVAGDPLLNKQATAYQPLIRFNQDGITHTFDAHQEPLTLDVSRQAISVMAQSQRKSYSNGSQKKPAKQSVWGHLRRCFYNPIEAHQSKPRRYALKKGQKLILPSLKPQERLSHLSISYDTPQAPDLTLEYDTKGHVYALTAEEDCVLGLVFIVHFDKAPIPERLQKKIRTFKSLFNQFTGFSQDEKPLKAALERCSNAAERLNCLKQFKKGYCAQVSLIAYLELLQEKEEGWFEEIRLITSDTHQFIEIKISGVWFSLDFWGGYTKPPKIYDPAKNPNNIVVQQYVHTRIAKDKAASDTEQRHDEKHTAAQTDASKTQLEQTQDLLEEAMLLEKAATPDVLNEAALRRDRLGDVFDKIRKAQAQSPGGLNHLLIAPSLKDAKNVKRQLIAAFPDAQVITPKTLQCTDVRVLNPDTYQIEYRPVGGPLVDWLDLKKHSDEPLTIIADWGAVDTHYVNRNSLLDVQRTLNGYALPENVHIISLSPYPLLQEDCPAFCSRQEVFQLSEEEVKDIPDGTGLSLCPPHGVYDQQVELYGSTQHWFTWLNGHVSLTGTGLQWTRGGLFDYFIKAALCETTPTSPSQATPLNILLKNPPLEDPGFMAYLEQLQRGCFVLFGTTYYLNRKIHYVYSKGYDWQTLKKNTATPPWTEASPFKVLNQATYYHFFKRYQKDSNWLTTQPGWLASFRSNALTLYVTSEFSEGEWFALCTEAKRHQVTLALIIPTNIAYPEALKERCHITALNLEEASVPPALTEVKKAALRFHLIPTADIVATTQGIQTANSDQACWVMTIPEQEIAQVLGYLKPQPVGHRLACRDLKTELYQALQDKNQIVILRGVFQPPLMDALMPYLLEKHEALTGRLFLVCDEPRSDLSCLRPLKPFASPGSDGFKRMSEAPSLFDRHEAFEPDEQSAQTLKSQPEDSGPLTIALQDAQAQCQRFMTRRFEKIQAAMKKSRCTLVLGETGTGKSHFFQHLANADLFWEETALKAWAQHRPNDPAQQTVLVLDEAFIIRPNKSLDRFQDPIDQDCIWIDGKRYPLTPQHKVVFLTNPAQYGDNRRVPDLFKRHRDIAVVSFERLSSAVLFEHILNPALGPAMTPTDKKAVAKVLLTAYQFCQRQGMATVTPRHLKWMARVVRHSLDNTSSLSASDRAQSVLTRFLPHLPLSVKASEALKAYLEKAGYLTAADSTLPRPQPLSPDFLWIESIHRAAYDLLTYFLNRSLEQAQAPSQSNDRPNPLPRLVLEGPPGVGKSQLVKALNQALTKTVHKTRLRVRSRLKQPGFVLCLLVLLGLPSLGTWLIDHFLLIPVLFSTPLALVLSFVSSGVLGVLLSFGVGYGFKDQRLFEPYEVTVPAIRTLAVNPLDKQHSDLIEAFHKGQAVLIEEGNSRFLDEKRINQLCSGYDLEGHPAKRPGFMMIVTQNPASGMSCRSIDSEALKGRSLKMTLPFPEPEALACLKKGHSDARLNALLTQYQRLYQDNPDAHPLPLRAIFKRFKQIARPAAHPLPAADTTPCKNSALSLPPLCDPTRAEDVLADNICAYPPIGAQIRDFDQSVKSVQLP